MNTNKKLRNKGAIKIIALFLAVFLFGAAVVFGATTTRSFDFGNLKSVFSRWLSDILRGGAKEPSKETSSGGQKEEAKLYEQRLDYEQAMIDAVARAEPAVVSVIVTKDLPIIEQCPYNPFGDLPPEFQEFFDFGPFQFSKPCQKGTKKQEVGGGSGFIVSEDGMVLTNKHVVLDEKADYTVLTNDGKKHKAKVLALDPVQDVAILRIESSSFKIVRLGDSDQVKLGQTAIAIGNALGEFRNTVSAGVISGLARSITAGGLGYSEKIEGVIQTDAAINPGNSGGPLLNLRGEVIGINVAIIGGAQNIGFAIPINNAKRALESVKRTGKIVVPYLGVRYLMLTPEIIEREKLSVEEGVLVRGDENGPGVMKGSPAEKAGIIAEDIILEIDNQAISKDHSLSLLIQKYNVGDEIALKILRNNKEIEIRVKLEERPKEIK